MKTCTGQAWGITCPKREKCSHHRATGEVLFFCHPETLAGFEPRDPFPTESEMFRLERQSAPLIDTTMSLF
jgi:hypothetical protein